MVDIVDYYHYQTAKNLILQLFQSTLVVQLMDTGHVAILHTQFLHFSIPYLLFLTLS